MNNNRYKKIKMKMFKKEFNTKKKKVEQLNKNNSNF